MKKLSIFVIPAMLVVSLLLWSVGPIIATAQEGDEYQSVDKPLSLIGGEHFLSIPSGSTVHHLPNGITRVFGPNGQPVLNTIDSKVAMVPVPSVGEIEATRIYQVPNESVVRKLGNGIQVDNHGNCIITVVDDSGRWDKKEPREKQSPPSPQPAQGSWYIEYAIDDEDVDDLDYFKASWEVPSNPSVTGYLIRNYIFNGIQHYDAGDQRDEIIQPVLSWNREAGSYEWLGTPVIAGGSTWSVWGPDIECDEYDSVYGRMTYNANYEYWKIRFRNNTTSSSINWERTDFPGGYPDNDDFTVVCALDSPNVSQNGHLCGDILFEDMSIRGNWEDIDVDWSTYTPGTGLGLTGLQVNVISDEEVELETPN